MIVEVRQGKGITHVRMGSFLEGVTRVCPGDKYDCDVGLAVALIKLAPKLDKRDRWLTKQLEGYSWKSIEIGDGSTARLIKSIILRDYIILKREPKNFGAVFAHVARLWMEGNHVVSTQV